MVTMREVERLVLGAFPGSASFTYDRWHHERDGERRLEVMCNIWIVSLQKNFEGRTWDEALGKLRVAFPDLNSKEQPMPDEEADYEAGS
jgi:hypothetical protein